MANIVKYVPAGSNYNPHTDSDVGTVVSYNSSTRRVEFKDIDFNALGALLGLTKPFTFKDCVLSPNVNPNAIFKPSTSAPYTLADFAGYNHTNKHNVIDDSIFTAYTTGDPSIPGNLYFAHSGSQYTGNYTMDLRTHTSIFTPNVHTVKVSFDVLMYYIGADTVVQDTIDSKTFSTTQLTSGRTQSTTSSFTFKKVDSGIAAVPIFYLKNIIVSLLDRYGNTIETESLPQIEIEYRWP